MTTYTTDGAVMWPPRKGEPRIEGLIAESGITPTGDFFNDVKLAFEQQLGLSDNSGFSLDDLWIMWLKDQMLYPYPGEPFNPNIVV
jgi:hypothetical protein